MFHNFWAWLLDKMFFKGSLGEVHFDLVNNRDGSISIPDGHVIIRPGSHFDDLRDPSERQNAVMVSFTVENEWQVRKITNALTHRVFAEAMLQGMNPIRIIWADQPETTPYDGVERVKEVVYDKPLLKFPGILPPAWENSPFKHAYNLINLVKMPAPGLPNMVGRAR